VVTEPIWLPAQGSIVPSVVSTGPPQEAERLAGYRRALEQGRLEVRLRRLDQAQQVLTALIPALRREVGQQHELLLASALVLQGRVDWRRRQRFAKPLPRGGKLYKPAGEPRAFEEALWLFRSHEQAIPAQPGASGLFTDYGIALQRKGRFAEALKKLENAIRTGAAPPVAFGYAGMAHLNLKQFEAAIDLLEKGLELAPDNKTLLETLAQALEKPEVNRVDEAVRIYCRAAMAAGRDNDLDSAREALQAALSLRPGDLQALTMFTLLLQSQGEAAEAIGVLEQRLELKEGDSSWVLGLYGMMLREAGRNDEAVKVFERAEVQSSQLAWILLEHARAVAPKDVDGARALIEKASKHLGENDQQVAQTRMEVELHVMGRLLGKFANTIGNKTPESIMSLVESSNVDLDKIAVLRAVVSIWPDNFDAREALIFTFLDQDDIDSAEDALKQAEEIIQEPPRILHLKGRVLEARGRRGEAIEFYRRAVNAGPKDVAASLSLASVLLDKNELGDAEMVLKEAERLFRDSPGLLHLQGRLQEAKGELSEAIRLYRRATRDEPKDDAPFVSLISALKKADRVEDAFYELDSRPKNPRALSEKGELLRTKGRFSEARACLQAAEKAFGEKTGRRDADLLRVRIDLGQTFVGQDFFEDAKAAFSRAIDVERRPPYEARALMASLLIDIAEYQRAADVIAATIALFPDKTDEAIKPRLGWLNLARGWSLRCAGRSSFAEIEQLFRTAVEFSPDDPLSRIVLASWLKRSEEKNLRNEGEKILIGATESATAQAIPLTSLGWVYFLLRRYEAAEHWLRAALPTATMKGEKVPAHDILAHFNLALVLLKLRPAEGKKEYSAAMTRARQKPEQRRRGLLHIALLDLVEAAGNRDKVINYNDGLPVWRRLRSELEKAHFPADLLGALPYPEGEITVRDAEASSN
jgi:tetratricopeptide (TPR) repeat protein